MHYTGPEQKCDEEKQSSTIDLYRIMEMPFWLNPAEAALAQEAHREDQRQDQA